MASEANRQELDEKVTALVSARFGGAYAHAITAYGIPADCQPGYVGSRRQRYH